MPRRFQAVLLEYATVAAQRSVTCTCPRISSQAQQCLPAVSTDIAKSMLV